ncbi:DNA oxidative demethylase AlkB [Falsihalocynthiibacter sp. SS001]|uniref:DNA oxidative demethylase AlkB n=1 Tax=Falsihalocynthiibacter sp. SS001 TaxID=3349698 RepID=UPI0036D3163E
MQSGLFDDIPQAPVTLAEGAVVLPQFVGDRSVAITEGLLAVAKAAPFRNMVTPGGRRMSVAMTNCGPLGWVSDAQGYRYTAHDPIGGAAWPEMPQVFAVLAKEAANAAGYEGFVPDACLINRYDIGSKLSLHQDRDEEGFEHPIVSVSLGIPAVFLFGGLNRSDPKRKIQLEHGDVVVWGGSSRLRYHGIQPIKDAQHPALGPFRYNLTFRRAKES